MSKVAPKIDSRTEADVTARLVDLLEQLTTHPAAPARQYPFEPWRQYDSATREPIGASAALIGVFARFAEIVIDRLNQVPDKNFLAFLDLLGAERLPPQPARVPITFALAAGRTQKADVPQGTQIAAPPPPGSKDPVVFETERALTLTAARLDALLTVDPIQDSYGDWSAYPSTFPIFQGDRASEHILYLGEGQLLAYPQIKNLGVEIELTADLPLGADAREVRWEYWNGSRWARLAPKADPTAGLMSSGTIDFGAIPVVPESAVNLRASRWLRCRLLTPLTRLPNAVAGMVRASQLPSIKSIVIAVRLQRTIAEGIAPDLGFINGAPLDLSKEFFPFGEKPKSHDTMFLASAEAFSRDRTASMSHPSVRVVKLVVSVANSHLVPAADSVRPSVDLELTWECWTGQDWQEVGTSAAAPWLALLELDPVPLLKTEETGAYAILQGTAQSGTRLTSSQLGSAGATDERYLTIGADGRFADKRKVAIGSNVFEFLADYAGRKGKAWVVEFLGTRTVELGIGVPSLPVDASSIDLGVKVSGSDAAQVTTIRVTNGATGTIVTQTLPAASVAVALAEGRNELLVEALADARRLAAGTAMISRRAAAPAVDDKGFADGTFGLAQSGVVTLRLPDTMARTAVNGQESFWLRVRIVKGGYGKEASYALKDPVKPEDGFILVPASFRPPIIAKIRIGYELTLDCTPAVCLTYNQLDYADCTLAAAGGAAAFAPFIEATQAGSPGLYMGFQPSTGEAGFSSTTLSLYSRRAEPRYGERTAPLSPESSQRVGKLGAAVTHGFVITNAAGRSEDFVIELLGYRWPASLTGTASRVTVAAGATVSFDVEVHVPIAAAIADSDRGFVRVRQLGDPDKVCSATFTTVAVVDRDASSAAVSWQYWNGTDWLKLSVQDGSDNFSRSGLLEFVAPPDFARRRLFGRDRYWVRAEWNLREYAVPPRLSRVLLNTTLARQTVTVVNEVLGSSNGAASQQFRSTRAPVLAGQRLEVREPDLPSVEDQKVLKKEEGDDAIPALADATSRPGNLWVRWHEAPDFHGSGPRDRHYTINHLTGEIRFGDGLNGRIPPPGTGNLRLVRYQTGGGSSGNCAAGAVAQLKTTVPYVDRATNPEAAAGGAEAETVDSLVTRMPRALRHRDRAVTVDDYEDLVRLASTEVARARCVPLRDLESDPLGNVPRPGFASVIVVPRTEDAKPLPTLELLARVSDFLQARAPASATAAVVGPLYLRVDVRAEVALLSPGGASAVENAVNARLAAFLHPLTGGLDGQGWDFGRAPHRSDLFSLIESVPGVDHVRYLELGESEDQPGVRQTGRFLVYSGNHRISLMFHET